MSLICASRQLRRHTILRRQLDGASFHFTLKKPCASRRFSRGCTSAPPARQIRSLFSRLRIRSNLIAYKLHAQASGTRLRDPCARRAHLSPRPVTVQQALAPPPRPPFCPFVLQDALTIPAPAHRSSYPRKPAWNKPGHRQLGARQKRGTVTQPLRRLLGGASGLFVCVERNIRRHTALLRQVWGELCCSCLTGASAPTRRRIRPRCLRGAEACCRLARLYHTSILGQPAGNCHSGMRNRAETLTATRLLTHVREG